MLDCNDLVPPRSAAGRCRRLSRPRRRRAPAVEHLRLGAGTFELPDASQGRLTTIRHQRHEQQRRKLLIAFARRRILTIPPHGLAPSWRWPVRMATAMTVRE
jgi:hypothetical protein